MVVERARDLFARHRWQALAELLEEMPRTELRAHPQLGYWLADSWRRLGRHNDALALLEQVTPAIKRSALPRLQLFRLNLLGMIRFETGQLAAAEAAWRELLERASGERDEEFVARATNNLGIIYTLHARAAEAVACYERALTSYRQLGLARHIAQSHQNLGITYRDLDHFDEADEHFRTAIRYAQEAHSDDEVARAEQERSLLIYLASRDARLARATVQRALGRFDALGDPIGHADSLRVLAMIELGEGYSERARAHAGQALRAAEAARHTLLEAEVLEVLAATGVERASLHARAEEKFGAIGAAEWGRRFRAMVQRIT
ncbi:MAG: tetratricopeptide repeat protein [Gemmatimonadota bacterium]